MTPVDERYVPSLEKLRELWLNRNYANTPEKIEYEVGWDQFTLNLARHSTIEILEELIPGLQVVLQNITDAAFNELPLGESLSRADIDLLHQKAIDAFKVAVQAAGDGMLE